MNFLGDKANRLLGLFWPKVFASSRSECLRIARPKAGLFVVIPMRQAGLPAPTSEQNKAWGPDAMDRSATPSIANSSSSSNFTDAPDTIWERIASKTRRNYFESALFKRVLLRLAYQGL